MANKHMKRCSTSVIIGEMQIKTTRKLHLTAIRIAIIKKKNLQTINAGEGIKKRESSCTVGENITCTVTMENIWSFHKNLKIELPYNPAIPLVGIYSEKTIISKNTLNWLFSSGGQSIGGSVSASVLPINIQD